MATQNTQSSQKVTIEPSDLHNYRIFNVLAMGNLSRALIRLRDFIKEDHNPVLERIADEVAASLRDADFADKFIFVHGEPLKKTELHTEKRNQVMKEISNKPQDWFEY